VITILIQLRCSHTFEITTAVNPFLSTWQCHKDGEQDAVAVLRCSGPAEDPNALFQVERAMPDETLNPAEHGY
jgi:hypothetical protein